MQFYDALMNEHGRYTVRQAFDIAFNTVNADNPNTPPQGDHFLLLPPGLRLTEWTLLLQVHNKPAWATLCVLVREGGGVDLVCLSQLVVVSSEHNCGSSSPLQI